MHRKMMTAVSCATLLLSLAGTVQDRTRSMGPRGYVLTIDGQNAGNIKSVRGGGIYTDVIVEQGATPGKRPGAPKFEEIVMELPPTSPAVQSLLNGFGQAGGRKNGSVSTLGSDLKGISEMNFSNAVVTEVSFPALDAATKDLGVITVKLAPEQVTNKVGGNIPGGGAGAMDSKSTLASSFRLEIDGLDCSRVRRIEPLVIKQAVAGNPVGDQRDYEAQAGAVEYGNLRLLVPQSEATSFVQWADAFLIRATDQNEKNGTLSLMSADMKTALLSISLHNLGVVRLSPAPTTPDRPAELLVEMYCERIELGKGSMPKAASGSAPATQVASGQEDSQPAPTPQRSPRPAPTVRDRSGLATREPIARTGIREPPQVEPKAAPAGRTSFHIQPNASLKSDVGRLVVRFPEGTGQRDYQLIQLPKSKEDRTGQVFYGSMAKEMPPGTYLVSLNGMLVEGVTIEGGSDTNLSLGVLRVKAPDTQGYEVILEDLDNAPAIARNVGTKDMALPVGSYFLRIKGAMTPFSIEEGKFTEFAAPE